MIVLLNNTFSHNFLFIYTFLYEKRVRYLNENVNEGRIEVYVLLHVLVILLFLFLLNLICCVCSNRLAVYYYN